MTRAAAWAVRAIASMVALATVPGLLAGCGASPKEVGSTGTDELTIPTPSPDPSDFIGPVQNPWFPLVPGTRWTYRQETPTGSATVVAEVLPTHRSIAGVQTTPVRWQVRSRGWGRTAVVRWYAVDGAGNVWWFGQRVSPHVPRLDRLAPHSFEAGRDGAEAGLVLAGAPRAGDGYLNAQQAHVVERRSTLLSLTATVATPTRTYRDTLVTRDLSTLEPLHTVLTYFSRGIGMVAQVDTTSVSTSLALVRVRRG
jgi:hypothetical protein